MKKRWSEDIRNAGSTSNRGSGNFIFLWWPLHYSFCPLSSFFCATFSSSGSSGRRDTQWALSPKIRPSPAASPRQALGVSKVLVENEINCFPGTTSSGVATDSTGMSQKGQDADADFKRASSRGVIPRAKIKSIKMTLVIVFGK